jgi:putative ABC transport system permease protein
VRAVTLSDGVPPGGGGVRFGMTIQIDGRGTVMDDPQVLLPSVSVQPDYFSLLGIPILRGRAFSAADSPTAPKTIIVNETMARRLWGTTDPVGQRVRFSEKGAWYTVVGVAGDVFQFDHSRPADMFGAYYPLSQSADTEFQLTYVLRTNGDTASAIAAAKAQIWSVDPGQPIFRIETARDMYGEFLAEPRFYAAVMLAFGAIGLAIAAIGLYGVLSYTMAQRTREFGIRLALGARPVDIMRLALRHGAALTALGLLAGAAASLLAAPALGSMLVGMPAGDPATYLVVAAALGTTALVACWLPGRRATRTDPVTALRAE